MKKRKIFILLMLLCMAGFSALGQTNKYTFSTNKDFSFFEDKVIEPREVKLYPNPALEYLVIEIQDKNLISVEFELNNIIGNTFQLRSERVTDNRYKIYVKDLNPGYYFLTVKDNNSNYKRAYRFVKK